MSCCGQSPFGSPIPCARSGKAVAAKSCRCPACPARIPFLVSYFLVPSSVLHVTLHVLLVHVLLSRHRSTQAWSFIFTRACFLYCLGVCFFKVIDKSLGAKDSSAMGDTSRVRFPLLLLVGSRTGQAQLSKLQAKLCKLSCASSFPLQCVSCSFSLLSVSQLLSHLRVFVRHRRLIVEDKRLDLTWSVLKLLRRKLHASSCHSALARFASSTLHSTCFH
jgi:hypothetical protein